MSNIQKDPLCKAANIEIPKQRKLKRACSSTGGKETGENSMASHWSYGRKKYINQWRGRSSSCIMIGDARIKLKGNKKIEEKNQINFGRLMRENHCPSYHGEILQQCMLYCRCSHGQKRSLSASGLRPQGPPRPSQMQRHAGTTTLIRSVQTWKWTGNDAVFH